MFLRRCGSLFATVAALAVGSLAIAGDDLPTVTIEGIQAPDEVSCYACENCCDGCAIAVPRGSCSPTPCSCNARRRTIA